ELRDSPGVPITTRGPSRSTSVPNWSNTDPKSPLWNVWTGVHPSPVTFSKTVTMPFPALQAGAPTTNRPSSTATDRPNQAETATAPSVILAVGASVPAVDSKTYAEPAGSTPHG